MTATEGIQIDSCPDNPLKQQLGCVVGLAAEGGGECVCTKFNLQHQGGKTWEGSISGQSFSWTITMKETGGLLEVLYDTTDPRCWGSDADPTGQQCDPFYLAAHATVDRDCCGCREPGEESSILWMEISDQVIATEVPPPVAPPCDSQTPEECCIIPGERPRDGGGARPDRACCPPISAGSSPGCGGPAPCPPTVFSKGPIRYSTGEIALNAVDIESGGFGIPWGHTRSFANRLSRNESVGNGFNWQVEQWSCAVADFDGNVTIVGRPNSALWFKKSDGGYVPDFNVRETLVHDTGNELYRLYELDGSYVEFDDFTGMFRRHVDPAGNQVEVVPLAINLAA